jgi:hypothetical protein
MSKAKTQFRQGDVFIEAASKVDESNLKKIAPDNKRVILAYGEVTGHAHAIDFNDAVLFEVPGSVPPRRMLKVTKDTVLKHEEHGPIQLPIGWFEIKLQREYTPEAIRNVAD